MKLITLHQPWASLIALGLKQYETRRWSTEYRGALLIHAAARPMRRDEINGIYHQLNEAPAEMERLVKALTWGAFPLGQVVAICNLLHCKRMKSNCNPKYLSVLRIDNAITEEITSLERSLGHWADGRYALQLSDVSPLPTPIPFTSRQGKLLDVPPSLTVMVQNQLPQLFPLTCHANR